MMMKFELIDAKRPKDLQPGDILLWHSKSWLSKAIQHFDGTPFNHASIVFDVIISPKGLDERALHVESVDRGVVLESVEAPELVKPGRIMVLRPELAFAARYSAAQRALRYLGRPYAFNTLVLLSVVKEQSKKGWPWWMYLVYGGTRALYFFKGLVARGGKHSLICSELVARAYRDAGFDLVDKDPDIITPGDLWRAYTENQSS